MRVVSIICALIKCKVGTDLSSCPLRKIVHQFCCQNTITAFLETNNFLGYTHFESPQIIFDMFGCQSKK